MTYMRGCMQNVTPMCEVNGRYSYYKRRKVINLRETEAAKTRDNPYSTMLPTNAVGYSFVCGCSRFQGVARLRIGMV